MSPDEISDLRSSLSLVSTLASTLAVVLPMTEEDGLADDARFAALELMDTMFEETLSVSSVIRRVFHAYVEREG